MKRLIMGLSMCLGLVICVLGIGFIMTTKSHAPKSAVTPDNTRYLKKPEILANCTANVASIKGKPCDIIFIGDSITEGWIWAGKAVWMKYYALRNACNFGVSGDETQNVLWRLTNMDVQNMKPKVAVILIGTNNTANNPREIADGIKAVLTDTQADFPGVKIILVSIMPCLHSNAKMRRVDSIIKDYADNKSVYYLDLLPLMPAVTTTTSTGQIETNWKGLGKDQLHPDASGYQIWADAMEPLLTKLLAGK